ncbi:MAG: oxidoreductase [Shimia sp.]|jgi:hypothetical protein|uniref:oxidoreductase n=1 Tax=Shimia sp. TaxID=1954381 RepID=UPI00405804A0
MFKSLVLTAAMTACMTLVTPNLAASDSSVESDVVLTVSGLTETDTQTATREFDLEMLKSLPAQTVETSTIWTDGPQTFVGVPLVDITTALDISGGMLKAYAINDYAVEIPVSDAIQGGPILAYSLNGKDMSIRDKGPLWIVYPYDANSRYKSETYYSRSIWQLDRLEVITSQ